MLTMAQIQELRMKILPTGGNSIVDILHQYRDQVTVTTIALENVPLIIIAKHGIIARIPVNGSAHKLSHPEEIATALKAFFSTRDMLYLYINLPAFVVPSYVDELLYELTERDDRKQELQKRIDEALDNKDKSAFIDLSRALAMLEQHNKE